MIKRNKYGLILTEALLAVALLAVGAIALGTIVNNAVQITGLSKNYLIAQNLATEGVEAVKNIRDTNWMIFPLPPKNAGNVDNPGVWLCLDPGTCSGITGTIAVEGNYILKNEGKWFLVAEEGGDLDLEEVEASDPDENYRLELVSQRYGAKEITTDTANYSPYYRSIKCLSNDQSEAQFEVKVQWWEGAKVRTISRIFTLYNYQYLDAAP